MQSIHQYITEARTTLKKAKKSVKTRVQKDPDKLVKTVRSKARAELGVDRGNNQRCFVVVKPGFVYLSRKIIEMFQEEGWKILKIRTKQLLLQEAHRLYNIHKNEKFYEPLCKYMSSAPTMAILFTRDITRKPNGKEFKSVDVLKDNIRRQYAESDMRNVIHSSDNPAHLEQESSIYF